MYKTILLTASIALALGGCAEMDTKPESAKPATAPAAAANPALDETIASAEKEIAAAKKVGIWRDTEKFLDEAKTAKSEGKAEDAMKLAKKALKQAQLAQKQVQAEANAKPNFPN